MGTFFEKILGFPMDYLIRTLQSHDLENCECTGHFLHWEHCNEIGWENSECAGNIPGGYGVGSLSISLQCTCNVPARDTTLCPQCERVELNRFSRFMSVLERQKNPKHSRSKVESHRGSVYWTCNDIISLKKMIASLWSWIRASAVTGGGGGHTWQVH